jgi:uncharacterized protein
MRAEGAYVDTSVLGAYYCPEPLSAAAERALRKVRPPVISPLSEVEFASLISRKGRTGELDAGRARQVLDLFESHVAEGYYRRMELTTEHFRRARQLINSHGSTLLTLDAIHLACAITASLLLLTADKDLARAAKHHGNSVTLIK